MGLTKTDLYQPETIQIAELAKVMGHPARIAILQHLIKSPQCITGDLTSAIGLAQATISQHLKELKSVGIIQGTIEGTSISYCINDERWNEVKNLFNDFLNSSSAPKSCC